MMNNLKATLQDLDKKLDSMVSDSFSRLRASIFEKIERKFNGPKDFPSEADESFHHKMLAGYRRLNGPTPIPFTEFRQSQKMENHT